MTKLGQATEVQILAGLRYIACGNGPHITPGQLEGLYREMRALEPPEDIGEMYLTTPHGTWTLTEENRNAHDLLKGDGKRIRFMIELKEGECLAEALTRQGLDPGLGYDFVKVPNLPEAPKIANAGHVCSWCGCDSFGGRTLTLNSGGETGRYNPTAAICKECVERNFGPRAEPKPVRAKRGKRGPVRQGRRRAKRRS